MDDNYDNPDMSVKHLGDCFHIDSTQVSKIFKSELGIHFSDYLLTKRMDMALSLLSESTMSIASVSCEVGYANYLTFKRAFTRYRGMSPKDYRMLFVSTEK